jgi:hypothetical protein
MLQPSPGRPIPTGGKNRNYGAGGSIIWNYGVGGSMIYLSAALLDEAIFRLAATAHNPPIVPKPPSAWLFPRICTKSMFDAG